MRFSPFLCVCRPVQFYHLEMQVGSHHHCQDTKCLTTWGELSVLPSLHFCTPLLSSASHSSVLHLYRFVILRMLYKWNQIVCDFLGLAVFSKHNVPELYPDCWLDQ